ncbi:hypothetical protein [Cytobacillus praedii]|uniref:hypothetical protein n=1 Tax=Cytobacillus praedii TaxID=1742358 RepID=UPI00070E132B|nr:hypothetical protein [Cytobacillus praedii]
MKKAVGVMILVFLIVTIMVFLFSNDFSKITRIVYQKYNHSDGNFSELIEIEDNDTINKLTRILNKANHQNTIYEKEFHEDYKLILFYPDETNETVRIWIGFGLDYDLLESDTRSGTYKLKYNKSREELLEILNYHEN